MKLSSSQIEQLDEAAYRSLERHIVECIKDESHERVRTSECLSFVRDVISRGRRLELGDDDIAAWAALAWFSNESAEVSLQMEATLEETPAWLRSSRIDYICDLAN